MGARSGSLVTASVLFVHHGIRRVCCQLGSLKLPRTTTVLTAPTYSVAVPRLNIILTLICRQYFTDRGLYFMPDGVTPVLPILIGNPNEQCRDPEVYNFGRTSEFLGQKNLNVRGAAGAIASVEVYAIHESYRGDNRLVTPQPATKNCLFCRRNYITTTWVSIRSIWKKGANGVLVLWAAGQ